MIRCNPAEQVGNEMADSSLVMPGADEDASMRAVAGKA